MKVIPSKDYVLLKEVVFENQGFSVGGFVVWKDLNSEDEDSYFILKPEAVMHQTPKGKITHRENIIGIVENVEI